jgi:hypothetical protein
MGEVMRAISVKQPWAWAIVQGHKVYENRTWTVGYRGPLLIHASRKRVDVGRRMPCGRRVPGEEEAIGGAVVGVVDLVDVVAADQLRGRGVADGYVIGPWCWVLENARAFDEPIVMSGKVSLFNVDDDRVREAVARAGRRGLKVL